MNPGGVRGDLVYDQISGGEQPGEVTYGEMFTVQPFSNTLVVKTCTGAQIDALLEQQFSCRPSTRMLLPSDSLRYSFSASAPVGSKVDPSSIKIDGVTVNPAANYRVTMNTFLADGGDGFAVFTTARTRSAARSTSTPRCGTSSSTAAAIAPPPLTRITRLP